MNVSIQSVPLTELDNKNWGPFIRLNQLDPPLLPLAAASPPNTSEAVAQI